MAVSVHQEDLLEHINGEGTLAGQIATKEACISLLDVLKVCAKISGNNIDITVSLAGIEIGHAVLNANNPSITIGGSEMGFKAEVTITLEVKLPPALEICGTVCVPILGCKKGCVNLHL